MKKNHAILSNDIVLLHSYYQYIIAMSEGKEQMHCFCESQKINGCIIVMNQEKTCIHFSFIKYQKLKTFSFQI